MNFLVQAYHWNWVTKAQLQAAVANKKLTAEQYKTITGEDCTAAE